MHPAPREHHAQHYLYTLLADYLRSRGATIRYAPQTGDAHWHAATNTLTLRADADPVTHLDIVRDFIDMSEPHCRPSQLGAQPRRHLQAVPA